MEREKIEAIHKFVDKIDFLKLDDSFLLRVQILDMYDLNSDYQFTADQISQDSKIPLSSVYNTIKRNVDRKCLKMFSMDIIDGKKVKKYGITNEGERRCDEFLSSFQRNYDNLAKELLGNRYQS